MIWLTWRQFRTQAVVAFVALAALAIYLVILGYQMRHAYTTDIVGCRPADCTGARRDFEEAYGARVASIGVLALPGFPGGQVPVVPLEDVVVPGLVVGESRALREPVQSGREHSVMQLRLPQDQLCGAGGFQQFRSHGSLMRATVVELHDDGLGQFSSTALATESAQLGQRTAAQCFLTQGIRTRRVCEGCGSQRHGGAFVGPVLLPETAVEWRPEKATPVPNR
jgi:hypothetical protein